MDTDSNQNSPKMVTDSEADLLKDRNLHTVFPEMIFVRKVFILSCLLCAHLLIVEILSDTVGMESVTYWFWRFVPYCLFLVLVAYYARPAVRLDWKTSFMVLFLFSVFLTFFVGLAGRLEIFSGISILQPGTSAREAIFSYLRLVAIFSFLAGSYFTLREIYQTKSELAQEVVRQRKTEMVLKRELEFDNLIAEILSRLARSSGPEVDDCIRTSVGQIAEFLGAEHGFVIQLASDSRSWSISHEWCAAGVAPLLEKYQGIGMGGVLAWSEEILKAGEVVQINRLRDIPPEASLTREQAESEGVKSRLTVPLLDQGGLLIGCIGLQSYSHEQQWSREDIRDLKLVAESFVNVIKRQQVEVALSQNENRYRTLFESAQDAIFLMQEDRFMDCNPHALRMFRCRREQIIGETPVRFSPPVQSDGRDSGCKATERIQAAISGVPQYFEWRHCRLDGSVFEVEVSLNRIELDEQAILLAIVRDITQRKQAEEALSESEERFRSAFDSAPIGMALVAPTGRWLRVNQSLCHIVGFSENELLATDFQSITHPDDLKTDLGFVRQMLDGSISHYYVEKRFLHKQGQVVWILLSVSLVRDGQGDPLYSIAQIQDITERIRAKEELQHSFEQIRALAARLQMIREEERTRVAREIHDELGQALTSIKIDLSSLVRQLSIGKEQERRTESILKLVDEAIHSVRRISTELRPGILDDLGLVAAVEWAAEDFEARTGTKCRLDLPEENVLTDQECATALFRIFQETLTNVARHANATQVDVHLFQEEGYLNLEVHDNGKGISKRQLSTGGSLGILGMRERALLLGGEFTIGGAPGKGTTVRARIPEAHRSDIGVRS